MKKIKLALASVAVMLAGASFAQTTLVADWQTVNVMKSTSGYPYGGIDLTANTTTGDVYTVGGFTTSVTLGSTTLTSTGGNDVYVARYSSSGTCLAAVKLGSNASDIPAGITYEPTSGAVYVAWYDGNNGGTVTKLNSSSLSTTTSWVIGVAMVPHAIRNAYNTVYVAGSFTNSVDFPSGSSSFITLTASNSCSCNDAFVASLNPSTGYFNGAFNPSSSTDANEIMAIHLRNHRVYATGYFKGSFKWSSTSTTVSVVVGQEIFVGTMGVSSTGQLTSVTPDLMRAGTSETGTGIHDRECGYGIVVNATAIYLTGNISNQSGLTFGSTAVSGAGGGGFIASIGFGTSSTVGTLNWVKAGSDCSLGGALKASIGYGAAVDANGDVLVTGEAFKYVNMGGSCVGGEGEPGFIAKFNSSGTLQYIDALDQLGNVTSISDGRAILVNGCNVYVTGNTKSSTSASFTTGNLPAVSTGTDPAMFLVMFNRDLTISNNIVDCATCSSGFPIVEHPAVTGGTAYSWSPSTYLSGTAVPSPVYTMSSCGSASTTYSINVTATCPDKPTVTITTGTSAIGAANAGPDQQLCPAPDFVTLGTPSVAGLTYRWTPTVVSDPTIAQPTFSLSGSLTLPITFVLTVIDVCGDSIRDTVTITQDPFCPRRMANPNGNTMVKDIYPNPSNGLFSLGLEQSDEAMNVTMMVTDVTGRVVLDKNISTTGGTQEIDLRDQPKGVYLLRVSHDDVTEMFRLVVE